MSTTRYADRRIQVADTLLFSLLFVVISMTGGNLAGRLLPTPLDVVVALLWGIAVGVVWGRFLIRVWAQ